MVSQATKLVKRTEALDVGAGGCSHKENFNHCDYYTQGFSQHSDSQIQCQDGYVKINFVSDILDIPFPDYPYDVIFSTEVIEHIPITIREFS